MKKNTSNCYYNNYSICTCKSSKNYDQRCSKESGCDDFISENDYFIAMMNGQKIEQDEVIQKKESKQVDYKKLELGKSKKALKKEAKAEAERNGTGSGFSLMDDPRFKDLFQSKK